MLIPNLEKIPETTGICQNRAIPIHNLCNPPSLETVSAPGRKKNGRCWKSIRNRFLLNRRGLGILLACVATGKNNGVSTTP